jgi:sugar/nucleoside kinase (ribokinase family)
VTGAAGVAPASTAPCVVVVGDVMVDVLVEVRAAFAHASDTPSRITTAPGGSAANQAVWLARAGAQVALVAAVGADPFGDVALAALHSEGVEPLVIRSSERPTGTVVALVEPDGQRSMLTDRGANLLLDAESLRGALESRGRVDHVHVSGYCLLDALTRPAGLTALALAEPLDATRSVDVSSVGPLRAIGPGRFLAQVAGCDYLLCNLEEGEGLSGAHGADAVLAALAPSFREIVLTLGARGAAVLDRDGALHRTGARGSAVADTVGAGDALCGTYLRWRLGGADADVALDAATQASADAVAARGARRWPVGYSRT